MMKVGPGEEERGRRRKRREEDEKNKKTSRVVLLDLRTKYNVDEIDWILASGIEIYFPHILQTIQCCGNLEFSPVNLFRHVTSKTRSQGVHLFKTISLGVLCCNSHAGAAIEP